MAKNDSIANFANHLFWTFLLQGLALIILGILVLIYPAILFVLVAANFVWMGVTTLYLAWKIRKFRSVLPFI